MESKSHRKTSLDLGAISDLTQSLELDAFVWWMSLDESVSAIWNTVRTVFWFESLRLASEPNAILSPPKSGDWIESRGFQFLETGVQAPVEYS